jgi:flagellar motor switch protein FliN/FliY
VETEEALVALADSTAEAVLPVLSTLAPGAVSKGHAAVVAAGSSPLEPFVYPGVAASVSYVDGVTGGNVFLITRLGARRLAASMMGQEPPESDDGSELGELELSALGEAMNQMMAAAAATLAHALGYEVEISTPQTQQLASSGEAEELYPKTPYATAVAYTLLGESCRLIQLVPNAFVVRMTRALADKAEEYEDHEPLYEIDAAQSTVPVRDITVRVSAELGRATLSLDNAVTLGTNAVIELDREADSPIDLYVNGRRFATGQLLLIDQSEWAIRIGPVLEMTPSDLTPNEGGI